MEKIYRVKLNSKGMPNFSTAVEIADRPQGEWIYCEDEYGIDGYRCSNCGRHIPWDYQHKFINFIDDYHTCPFCDARMKGAEDE